MSRDVRELADQVWAIAESISNVNVYRGDFVDADGTPVDPPADDDGHVYAYAIFYFNGGRAFSRRVAGSRGTLGWGFQITCAGGDDERALAAVNVIRNAFTGTLLTFEDGIKPRRLVEDEADPGPLRRDDTVRPSRMYLPLYFRTQI